MNFNLSDRQYLRVTAAAVVASIVGMVLAVVATVTATSDTVAAVTLCLGLAAFALTIVSADVLWSLLRERNS